MNVLYRLLMFAALVLASGLSIGQTRNVLLMGAEQDSIERENLGNRRFHSALRAYTSDPDTSRVFGLQRSAGGHRFVLEPLLMLQGGYQKECDNYTDAFAGLSSTYSYGKKFTLSASLMGGYSQPMMYTRMLADSIGRFPQYDGYSRRGNGYMARYFEFYANYRPADYLMLRLGKGKKFVGDGYRSAIMSASNSGMYYFDTDVELGSFKYVFSINTAQNWDNNCGSFRQMYMIYHLFSYNPARWLTIGGYETVVMIRRDSVDNTRFADLHYMNPMLFFRPVEYSLGSPDNALMGVFGKIRFLKNHVAYGQFMLDDFNFREIKDHDGSWNNKFAIQAGLKGFLGRFTYLAEYNYIRPYIYSHDKSVNSYSMFHQPLANPWGANLKEAVLCLKYRIRNLGMDILLDHVEMGRDYDKYSMGNNIFRPYTLHKANFDNYVGQGDNQKNMNIQLGAQYNAPWLRNITLLARGGIQQMGGVSNGYVIIGLSTGRIFRDNSL